MLATLLGVTLALPAAAQWKWRDKAGQTQYSDLPPPPGVPEHDILQRPTGATARRAIAPPPAAVASAAPGTPASALVPAPKASDPELEARRKQAQQEQDDKKKAEDAKTDAKNAAVHAENCSRAKAQQRTIDSGVRMTRTNEKGEREYLDDAARATEARRTQEVIASECK